MAKRPYDARVGDRVRVTYETTLTYSGRRPPGGMVLLGEFDNTDWHVHPHPAVGDRKIVNVEVLEPAEPAPSGVVVTYRDGGRSTYPGGTGWTLHEGLLTITANQKALAALPLALVESVAHAGAQS